MSGPKPRPDILAITPYVPGNARAKGFAHPIKLSANENPLGASPAAKAAYRATIDELHLYPDARASRLREAIAAKFTLSPERLIFGCGSDEIFLLACITLIEPGDNIVQPEFGFAAWAIAARAAGASVRSAPEDDFKVDVDALLAAVDARTRIVFVANPANPTGTCVTFDQIRRLHKKLRSDVLLLLDEAYAEFAVDFPGFESGLSLAREAENTLVTRTFSKAYGLAALRVGWAYGAPSLIAAIERIRQPFNINRPAEAAAATALSDDRFLQRSVAHVARWRPRYAEALSSAGFRPIASATNFITFEIPSASGWTATSFEAYLAEHGVIVRNLANYGMPNCLRITIGSDEDSRMTLALIVTGRSGVASNRAELHNRAGISQTGDSTAQS
jgi:histidinol-phosphate aminotransferase